MVPSSGVLFIMFTRRVHLPIPLCYFSPLRGLFLGQMNELQHTLTAKTNESFNFKLFLLSASIAFGQNKGTKTTTILGKAEKKKKIIIFLTT